MKLAWTSRSDGMRFHDGIGPTGLVDEDRKLRDVRVPLDQRRPRARAGEHLSEERPHLRSDSRAVVVDQNRDTIGIVDAGTGQVVILDGVRSKLVEISVPVVPGITRAKSNDV